jgi:hypothetical protein
MQQLIETLGAVTRASIIGSSTEDLFLRRILRTWPCNVPAVETTSWQASRIQALIGNVQEAIHHAQTCLGYSANLEPFYLGYAYEALARAARLMDDAANFAEYISRKPNPWLNMSRTNKIASC